MNKWFILIVNMNKSVILLSALVFAALTYYVSERYFGAVDTSVHTPVNVHVVDQDAVALADQLRQAKEAESRDVALLRSLMGSLDTQTLADARSAANDAHKSLTTTLDHEAGVVRSTMTKQIDPIAKKIISPDPTFEQNIRDERTGIEIIFKTWKSAYGPDVLQYLRDLDAILSSLKAGDNGLTQSQIDAYKKQVDAAIDQVIGVVDDTTAAQEAAQAADDNVAAKEKVGDAQAIADQKQAILDDQKRIADLEASLQEVQGGGTDSGAGSSGDSGGSGAGSGNSGSGVPYVPPAPPAPSQSPADNTPAPASPPTDQGNTTSVPPVPPTPPATDTPPSQSPNQPPTGQDNSGNTGGNIGYYGNPNFYQIYTDASSTIDPAVLLLQQQFEDSLKNLPPHLMQF